MMSTGRATSVARHLGQRSYFPLLGLGGERHAGPGGLLLSESVSAILSKIDSGLPGPKHPTMLLLVSNLLRSFPSP